MEDLAWLAQSSEVKKQAEIEKQKRNLQKTANKFEKEKAIETQKEA